MTASASPAAGAATAALAAPSGQPASAPLTRVALAYIVANGAATLFFAVWLLGGRSRLGALLAQHRPGIGSPVLQLRLPLWRSRMMLALVFIGFVAAGVGERLMHGVVHGGGQLGQRPRRERLGVGDPRVAPERLGGGDDHRPRGGHVALRGQPVRFGGECVERGRSARLHARVHGVGAQWRSRARDGRC